MTARIAILLNLLVLTGLAWSQDASGIKTANLKDADLKLMNNHDPESERENFELLPGFEVNLFAAEPMLANPVHMVWDSRGRLWVACSWAYPQIKPGEVANDKIIILEDTDGDGAADESTVFAEGLYVPTGIELANGGCYVGQSPDVFFFKDTDGDDVADVKELALTGFGIEDSHHSISAWRRGPGGWIYFQEGIFLHAQVETQYGVVRNFNGGVYQFNPRTQELRVFCTGTGGNPWGHVIDRWGQSFMVNNPRIMYLSPGTGNSGEKLQLKPLISTEKQCGGDLITGTHMPEEMQGQLMSGRFKSRAVIRYEFIEDGAGFNANVLEPLIKSKHPNFRPVDVKMGPDGAAYVADWYNSIINHAQHDFRDPRRDHTHGRIWRVTAKDRPLVRKPQLVGKPVAELVPHLRSPEAWIRHQVRLELSERDPDEVRKELEAWAGALSPSDPECAQHLVEAMWACQNVERASEGILNRVVSCESGHARSAGARVVRYWHDQLSDPVAIIAKLAGDPFPRTRMEAVLSAGFIPKAEAFAAALNVLDHERDASIDAALRQTAAALEPYWRPALLEGAIEFARAEHRAFAEQEAGIGFEKRLAAFLRNPMPEADEIAAVKAQLIADGTSGQVQSVVSALTKRGGLKSQAAAEGMLEALGSLGRAGELSMGRRMNPLPKLLKSKDAAVAAAAADAIGAWKINSAGEALGSILRDGERDPDLRIAAAVALGELGKTEFAEELKRIAAEGDIESRYHAVTGLVRFDVEDAAILAAKLLGENPGDANPVPLVRGFLRWRRGPNALLASVNGQALHPVVLERVSAFHRRTGQLPGKVAKLFEAAPSGSLSVSLRKENRDRLTGDVEKLGDPARGELVYRRKSLACTSCHALGSVGPETGPNLVAVGAAATTGYMVESILEPNKAIAEHYENMMFTLRDGAVRMGVVTFKSEKVTVIRDSAQGGAEVRIPAGEIQRVQAMPSLMPGGLADQLQSRQEFLDLAKFLSVLGRPGPYANDERPVIRKWRVVSGEAAGPPADGADWAPAFSLVSGVLPASDFPDGDTTYARGLVNVLVPGSVRLRWNDTTGIRLWIDGREVREVDEPLTLLKGRRSVTVGIDRSARGETGLRVELESPEGSSGRFQPEGGA